METIKILGIAPYHEMEGLMQELARGFDNVEMHTFTGYYKNAIEFTKAFPDEKFDVIISRGGTATLLEELIDTPVIHVDVSTFDILRVMMQALRYSQHAAVVSYPFVTSRVETLAEILRLNIRTVTFEKPDQIPAAVAKSRELGVDLIVGGAATKEPALAAGAQFILITSSRESVEASIHQAIDHCHMIHGALESNRLFQSLVDKNDSGLLLFDSGFRLCYVNLMARQMLNDITKLESLLRNQLPTLKMNGKLRLIKKLNNDIYEVNGTVLASDQREYYQFAVRFRSVGYHPVSFAALEDPETLLQKKELIGSDELYLRPLLKTIQTAASSTLPVLIQGPVGTRKGLVARYIHSHGSASSFIRMQCSNMTEKGWKTLLNNLDSPIHSTGYTVYFENICELPEKLQIQLQSYMEDTHMARRHRLISSSQCDLSTAVAQGKFLGRLYLLLSGFTVNVPALAQRREDIPAFINLLIPQLNLSSSQSVIGPEPDAMELLVNFSWPLNLLQLEKVLRQLVAASSSFYISAQAVSAVLADEIQETVSATEPLDLSGTLDQIEQRVLLRVLQEEGMNQSAAAKRLGISRSTLWRKLSDA